MVHVPLIVAASSTGDIVIVAILTVAFVAFAMAIGIAVDRQSDLARQIRQAERRRQREREQRGREGGRP
jgi:hypothetical protein